MKKEKSLGLATLQGMSVRELSCLRQKCFRLIVGQRLSLQVNQNDFISLITLIHTAFSYTC